MKQHPDTTIFALASGAGRAGIAVIRISGKACRSLAKTLTGTDLPLARQASRRRFIDPGINEIIDDGLIIWFPEPASFTGEDVLELHVHGGPAVLSAFFECLCIMPDIRQAEAGEFSRRAFLNGKLDLTQAEGLADLIAAETRQQARQARRQLDGALGELYRDWQERLIKALVYLEAEIDFAPEEEVSDGLLTVIGPDLQRLRAEIDQHLGDDRRGERLRAGLQVALIGPPNAGKSTLLNLLARREVAIVTDIPGTTRDVLEVPLDLGGYPLTIVDTAGLRSTTDPIEMIGVDRARGKARDADIVLALFDGAIWPGIDMETSKLIDERTLVLLNKIDLLGQEAIATIGHRDVIGLSCRTGEGIERLEEALEALARQRMAASDVPVLTRARHREALTEVTASLSSFHRDATPELVLAAEDLRCAMNAMGRITGAVGVEDVLDRIFGEFCIGK